MPIVTDLLSESSRPAAWREFLQSAECPRARAHLEAMLTRIQKSYRAGDRKKFQYQTRQYLTSYDARIAATRLASRKMRWYRRPNKQQLKSIAEGLNPYEGTQEEVRLMLIPKGSPGKFRPTLAFGIENRALQYLVLSLLYAIAELHPRQFATRGVVPAIAEVTKAMKAGYLHATETDISDFYPSFDGTKLVGLIPLPKKVIESVLTSRHLNIVCSEPMWTEYVCNDSTASWFGPADTDHGEISPLEKYLADARRGIPQGSCVSPIVSEMLLAPVLHQVPAGLEVVAYADNILIMTKDKGDSAAIESLGGALKAHPAGQLWPKVTPFQPGGPIEFLGYRLAACEDDVRIEPTDENLKQFERRMNAGLARLKGSPSSLPERRKIVRELNSDLSSHVSNFRLCDGMENQRQQWLARIATAAQGGPIMP